MAIRFEKKDGLSRKASIKEIFEEAIQKVKKDNEVVTIQGNFYFDEVDFIRNSYCLFPASVKRNTKGSGCHCYFNILPKKIKKNQLGRDKEI